FDTLLLNQTTGNGSLDAANSTYLPYYLHSVSVSAGYVLFNLLVLLLCVGGNALVCLVVLRNRSMRSVINLFILNLAVSDLLVGIFCVPTTLIDSLITSGLPFLRNTWTYLFDHSKPPSVTPPFWLYHNRRVPITALLAILLIWLLAFAIIFPSAATLTVMHLQDTYMVQGNQTYPLFVCYEDWPRPRLQRIYTTVIFVHVYLAPLGLISVMYGYISIKLVSKLQQAGLARVVKMFIMVAVLFLVSWLPLWMLMLLAIYRDLDQHQIDFLSSYLFPIAHWLAFSNSGINLVIYGFYSENFRRGFQAVVVCHSCVPMEAPTSSGCCWSALPPNKVSSRNPGVSARSLPHTDQRLTVFPRGMPPGIQGILLEGINRIAAPNQVTSAWE
uniref:Neuropeptide FF receptor 1 like 1 n=1 Tax=Scleropages formosus TaxID=113540 RepID=A0A8C9R9G5_SCLFO